MFHASGIILHTLQIVYLNLKIQFNNKIPFASLLGNMLYVNKGLQCTDCTVMWQCCNVNDRFMLEHNNDSMNVLSRYVLYYTRKLFILI